MQKPTIKIFLFLILGCIVAEQVSYFLTDQVMEIEMKEKKGETDKDMDDSLEKEAAKEKLSKEFDRPSLKGESKLTKAILSDYSIGLFQNPFIAIFSPPPDRG